jgi:hypothetical protein
MSESPEERPSPPAANVGGEVTPLDLPRHDAYTTCPKCAVSLTEHHTVRWHETAMPYNVGSAADDQEPCTAVQGLGEHLCHRCDNCRFCWASQIAEPADD